MPKISHTYHCMSSLICAVMTCPDVSVPTWWKCICMRIQTSSVAVWIFCPPLSQQQTLFICLFVFFQGWPKCQRWLKRGSKSWRTRSTGRCWSTPWTLSKSCCLFLYQVSSYAAAYVLVLVWGWTQMALQVTEHPTVVMATLIITVISCQGCLHPQSCSSSPTVRALLYCSCCKLYIQAWNVNVFLF